MMRLLVMVDRDFFIVDLGFMVFGVSCAGGDQPVSVSTTGAEAASTAARSGLFELRASGPLTEAEVRGRVPLAADDPKGVKPEDNEVIVTTWEQAAPLIGEDPSSTPGLGSTSAGHGCHRARSDHQHRPTSGSAAEDLRELHHRVRDPVSPTVLLSPTDSTGA